MKDIKIVRVGRQTLLAADFWDNFVGLCGDDTPIYMQSWYIEIASKNSWEAFLMYHDGVLIGALPCAVKYKFGILRTAYMPVFVQQLGIIYIEQYAKQIHEAAFLFFREMKKRYLWFRYSFSCHNYQSNIGLPAKKLTKRLTYKLDLNRDINQIRAGFSNSHRQSIKKAVPCLIYQNQDLLPVLIDYFVKSKITSIKSVKAKDYARLLALATRAFELGMAQVWVAQDDQAQILAGALFIEYKGQIVYLFSYTSELGRRQKTMFGLFDHCMQEWAGKYRFLDFEGSKQVVGSFFSSFGSQAHYFWHWDQVFWQKR